MWTVSARGTEAPQEALARSESGHAGHGMFTPHLQAEVEPPKSPQNQVKEVAPGRAISVRAVRSALAPPSTAL